MKQDGCKSIEIYNSKTTYCAGLGRNVELAAKKQGLTVEGNEGIDPKAPNYRSLASKIKSDCFIYTGEIENNGIQLAQGRRDRAARTRSCTAATASCSTTRPTRRRACRPTSASQFKGTIATLDPEELRARGQEVLRGLREGVQRRRARTRTRSTATRRWT